MSHKPIDIGQAHFQGMLQQNMLQGHKPKNCATWMTWVNRFLQNKQIRKLKGWNKCLRTILVLAGWSGGNK